MSWWAFPTLGSSLSKTHMESLTHLRLPRGVLSHGDQAVAKTSASLCHEPAVLLDHLRSRLLDLWSQMLDLRALPCPRHHCLAFPLPVRSWPSFVCQSPKEADSPHSRSFLRFLSYLVRDGFEMGAAGVAVWDVTPVSGA